MVDSDTGATQIAGGHPLGFGTPLGAVPDPQHCRSAGTAVATIPFEGHY